MSSLPPLHSSSSALALRRGDPRRLRRRRAEDPASRCSTASASKGSRAPPSTSRSRSSPAASRAADVEVAVSGQFQRQGSICPARRHRHGRGHGERARRSTSKAASTLLEDRGFVNYRGTEYEIDPNNFAFARSIFLPGSEAEGKDSDPEIVACREALAGTSISELRRESARTRAAPRSAATETTKISGELDVAVRGRRLPRPGRATPAAAPSSKRSRRCRSMNCGSSRTNSSGAVEEATDRGLRRRRRHHPPPRRRVQRPGATGSRSAVSLDLSLTEVNEEQKIEAPAGGKPLLVLFAEARHQPDRVPHLPAAAKWCDLLLEKVTADALP